jgi:hypothetical protein
MGARPSLSFSAPPGVSIQIGATTPDPKVKGATVWSDLAKQTLCWDGAQWLPLARTYKHEQGVPSATWVVAHGLQKIPAVTVIDNEGNEVRGDVRHDSTEQLTLTFAYPFSGRVHCN